MRVVIITGTRPHHKNLCAAIATEHEVVGVIHPAGKRLSMWNRLNRLSRRVRSHGWPIVALHFLGAGASISKPRDCGYLDETRFAEGLEAYDTISGHLIHSSCDVASSTTSDLVRALKPDVTLCLGGPVYPQSLIEASPLTLNFHGGISPIYNGNASIRFAFANGHPHLCGGTLMVMGTRIDGGRILAHFIPAIESGDSPESLYAKVVAAAPRMYLNVISHIASGGQLASVPQPRPLFYTRGLEMGWFHRAMIARHLRTDLAAQHERAEKLVEYWRESDAKTAHRLYAATISSLLWNGSSQQN